MGWGQTRLARGARTRYAAEISAIDKAMRAWNPFVARKRGRGPIALTCSCVPPRSFRVHQGVADRGASGVRCAASSSSLPKPELQRRLLRPGYGGHWPGAIAHLEERYLCTVEVRGSSPLGSTWTLGRPCLDSGRPLP